MYRQGDRCPCSCRTHFYNSPAEAATKLLKMRMSGGIKHIELNKGILENASGVWRMHAQMEANQILEAETSQYLSSY
jgi:hypothetical protein